MAEFSISIDLQAALNPQRIIDEKVLPLLNQAVYAVAQQASANWIEGIQRAKLWSGEKDAYSATIKFQMTGPFSALVWSDYKYAEDIETGRPARDLKKMLDTSIKVRQSKDGSRYLIIPFRHNTPGNDVHAPSMPQNIYAQAKQLNLSTIVGHSRRESGTGAWSIKTKAPATVRKRLYNWGDSLMGQSIPKQYQGMVKINTATGEGKKSSSYLTFRVMSEKSSGWIVPPQPGQHIVQKVADDLRPIAEQIFSEAVRRSLKP